MCTQAITFNTTPPPPPPPPLKHTHTQSRPDKSAHPNICTNQQPVTFSASPKEVARQIGKVMKCYRLAKYFIYYICPYILYFYPFKLFVIFQYI